MRLNHLDLHVPDVALTTGFFIRYFGLKLRETRGRNGLAILNDDAGMELVVSHAIEKFGGIDQVKLGAVTYHIGFMLPCKQDVDRVFNSLQDDGVDLWDVPKPMRGGWLFYCVAPGNILIEVGWRPDE